MRRLISLTLLLLFSFSLIAPALASVSVSSANLPACCRRNGAHHCMGMMAQAARSSSQTSLSAVPQRCPAWPAVVIQLPHGDHAVLSASLLFAEIVSNPAQKPQTQACARVALDRSRQKRGPPALPV